MKRRGQGEGSIYQRSDGLWVAVVNVGWRNGRRRRKAMYAKTRREVQGKLAAARRARDKGLPLPAERYTLGEFLTGWLSDVAEPSVRPSTALRYRQLLEKHVIPSLGRRPVARLAPEDLQALYAEKTREGLAPRTVGHIHRVLHCALQDAVLKGTSARNVCDVVRPPKVTLQEMRVLAPDEARKLLEAAFGDPLEALYVVAVTAGPRQGELLALKWRDVDLDSGKIRIQRTVRRGAATRLPDGSKVSGKMIEDEPKSAASRRTVSLAPIATAALRGHKMRQSAARRAALAWDDLDLVFPNEIGRHIEPQNLLRRSFRALLERAELPHIRFHDLRHTAATLLLVQGVHPRIVQEMLGHSSIVLTLQTYSHVLPGMQDEAAAKMQALLVAH